ncbi:hypothetical protein AC244_05225 [Ensifer adhaerens]|uniref:Uncharacterized protein n=2 Tax=Sinorhizobium/Ensifer group TaxID=227292 RepID=A0A0L8C216_ENSAD|nr:hypothetical protein AC244_05225 [Ensifer adhaerens]
MVAPTFDGYDMRTSRILAGLIERHDELELKLDFLECTSTALSDDGTLTELRHTLKEIRRDIARNRARSR